MSRILTLRREQARMLGYRDYADYRLEMNMAGCGETAVDFEKELFEKTLPYFEEEVRGMERFAHALGIDELQPWDIAYLIQRMRKDQFELDPEELRPYFPPGSRLEGPIRDQPSPLRRSDHPKRESRRVGSLCGILRTS